MGKVEDSLFKLLMNCGIQCNTRELVYLVLTVIIINILDIRVVYEYQKSGREKNIESPC